MLRFLTLPRLVALIVIVSIAGLPSAAAPAAAQVVPVMAVPEELGFPTAAAPTAPDATSPTLGAANSFAVLAGTALSNIPTSAITGDVGLSPAAGTNYSGLTALQVMGTIYAVDATGPAGSVNNPGLLTSAKAGLVAAFNALSAPPNVACTVDYGAVTKDLVGLTLVPGVYCADAFSLSGTLTLNDTGDPFGVWIFRSALSTLITTPGVGAKVQFLNGTGSSCNVWWKVASSATIGSGTTFIGNILALTSISLGTGASLNGRALARNGAVTLHSNTINRPICALATQSMTTEIHNANHVEVTYALTGTIVHDMATVTGTLGIPTGVVSFTVFANLNCSGVGTFAGAVALNAAGVADPSSTATLSSAGLSYLAHYNGNAPYNAAVGQCEILIPLLRVAIPSITTKIHDANHVEVTYAFTGTVVHDMATVTGTPGLPIPTGVVTFTVFANQNCSGVGTFAGAVPLNTAGVADPSNTATLTSAGLSYRALYNGNTTYNAAVGPCEVLAAYPTAVELLYFKADRLTGQQVQLKWATALEVDNFGFNLYRANVNDLGHANLIHFEPAVTQGSGSGAAYVYIDTDPYDGPSWYWLADVDTKGRETFHASINAPEQSYMYPVYLPLVNRE